MIDQILQATMQNMEHNTMMNPSTNEILNFSVVHVGTVANSSRMVKQDLFELP